MRIGLVLKGDLNMQSGGFLYDRTVVRYLRNRGNQVVTFTLPWCAYPLSLALNLSVSLFRRLRRTPVDVLIQDELAHPSLLILNRWLKTISVVPLVAIVHHLRCSELRAPWKNFLYRLVENKYLKSLDGFIFNSNATRQVVTHLLGDTKPAVLAPPGGDRFAVKVAENSVRARSFGEGPLKIVFLGNIIPRKELHTLISGLSLLEPGTWHLSVVGSWEADGAYAGLVRKEVQRSGLTPYVSFLGESPDRELACLLAESQVLAVPSSYEGFGIVYVEGMGFGLPVIAAHAGGAEDIVRDGINGFLVHPGDADAIARHLSALISDRGRLCAMSIEALRGFAVHPTWMETGERIHQFLQGLVR
jgi:glycosyltransferase involved in cell wall biosynthesis